MIEVKIINKLNDALNKYQERTGTKRLWIAEQLGYNTRQAFSKAVKSNATSLDTYARFARFLQCDIKDLFEIEYYEDGNKIDF